MSQDEQETRINQGESFAWRLSMARVRDYLGDIFDTLSYFEKGKIVSANPESHGDIVLARKDIGTSYHIAAVHDDALQNITDIVRGKDLERPDIHLKTSWLWRKPASLRKVIL